MALQVLGISGSLRSPSATMTAVQIALAGAKDAGAETVFVDLAELGLPFCDGRDDSDTYPEVVQTFRKLVRDSAGVIIGTPEYHNSMTGALKNAIDLCEWEDFAHKMVGVIGVAGGAMGAVNSINHLRTVMRGVGAWVVPHQVSIPHANRAITDGSTVLDPQLEVRLLKLGRDVTKFARLIAAGIIEIDETEEV